VRWYAKSVRYASRVTTTTTRTRTRRGPAIIPTTLSAAAAANGARATDSRRPGPGQTFFVTLSRRPGPGKPVSRPCRVARAAQRTRARTKLCSLYSLWTLMVRGTVLYIIIYFFYFRRRRAFRRSVVIVFLLHPNGVRDFVKIMIYP